MANLRPEVHFFRQPLFFCLYFSFSFTLPLNLLLLEIASTKTDTYRWLSLTRSLAIPSRSLHLALPHYASREVNNK